MNSEIEALFKQGEKAEKSHDFEGALECYQKILQKDPQEDHAYYCLANIFAIRGLVPQVVQQYLKLADVLESKGQLDGAMEVCQWVISIEPAGTQSRLKLIDLLEKQARKKEAIQQSLILSRIFSALGHGEQSIELLQKRRELDPGNADLVLQLGEVYIKQGQIGEGIALHKAIAKELLNKEDYNHALDALKRIKALKPDDLENLSTLGEVYVHLGKLDEAKAEYRLILRQDLNHIGALSQLGLIAKMQGSWDEARLPFRKIVELDPNNAFGRENFAEVNEVLGNQVEAIKHYLIAAEYYEKDRNQEKAIEIYQNILALDPEHATAQKRLQTLGGAVVPKKRVAAPVAQRQRTILRSAEEPVYEREEAGTPDASAPSKEAEVEESEQPVRPEVEAGEPAASLSQPAQESQPSSETSKPGFISKWLLKPGIKSKAAPVEGKSGASSKPKISPDQPPSVEGGIPRTRPVSKPMLIRSRDQAAPASTPGSVPIHDEERKPGEPAEPIQNQGKTGAVIEEIEFPDTGEGVQAVYVDQQPVQDHHEEIREEALEIKEPPESEQSVEKVEELHPVEDVAQAEEERPVVEQAPLAEEKSPVVEQAPPVEERQIMREISLPEVQPLQASGSAAEEKTAQAARAESSDVDQLLAQGKVNSAIQLCKEALKEAPGDRHLKLLLGEIYFKYAMLEEARDCFKDASRDARDPKVFSTLAEIYLWLGQGDEWAESATSYASFELSGGNVEKALEAINHVLAWNPSHVKARQILISLLREQDLQSLAIYHHKVLIESLEASNALSELVPVYRQLLEVKPEAFPVRYKLALCYQELGKVTEAKQEFVFLSTYFGAHGERDKEADYLERAMALDQTDEGIIQRLRDVYSALGKKDAATLLELKLGTLAAEKGELESALTSFRKVLEAEPENEEAMSGVVDLYTQTKDSERALSMGKRLGELYMKKGESQKAISLYQNLLKIEPDNFALHRGLAMLYSQGNQAKEAVQEFMTLGHLACNKALFDDAIDAYRQVLSIDGTHKDARYQLGVVLADHKNNWESALAEFKKVKGLDPHHTAALSRLAKGYALQGNIETALQYVHELIRLDPANSALIEEFARETEARLQKEPDNIPLRFNFGILCQESGKLENAIKEFQIVVRKSPELALRAYVYMGQCWEEKAVREKEDALYQTALKVYQKGMEVKGHKDEDYLDLKYSIAKLYETLARLADAITLYQEIVSVDMEYKDARDRKRQLEEEVSSGKVTRLPSSRSRESAP